MSAKFQVGEKGVTLSGGQKQRIALARALYSRAKHLILDDCLSAVDSHTARHLYEYALNGELAAGRTRVLVTHYVGLCLREASYVVVIRDGAVNDHGTPSEIMSRGAVSDIMEVDAVEETKEVTKKELNVSQTIKTGKLVQKEERSQGSVSLSVYWLYMKACGGPLFWMLLLLAQCGPQALQVAQSNLVRVWSDAYAGEKPVEPGFYIGIYFGIGIIAVFADAFKDIVMFKGSLEAGNTLHSQLLNRVINARPRFFDSTPVGRILNRFSRDIQVIDQDIASSLNWLLYLVIQAIAIIMVIAVITPVFLLGAIVVTFIYASFTVYYLAASRELKRMESTTKSPLLSMFGETVT